METAIRTHRNNFFLSIFGLCISLVSFATQPSISISGIYRGKNLLIRNYTGENDFGLTVKKITVNGAIVPLKQNGDVTEVDFSILPIQLGTQVEVIVQYDEERVPVVSNPDALESYFFESQTSPDRQLSIE